MDLSECNIKVISLVCDKNTVRERLEKDVTNGIREADVTERSVERIELYTKLNTIKIDTTDKSVDDICGEIMH